MNEEPSVSDLIDIAAHSEGSEFDALFRKVASLRAQHHQTALPKKESDLLQKINRQFPDDKRLEVLCEKLEHNTLLETEYLEQVRLVDEHEAFMLQRLRYLSRLATLRKISLMDLIKQLEISPN